MSLHSAAEARALAGPLVRLFVTGLARRPTPSELTPLIERLRAGDDLGDAAAAMACSAEFLARHGPDGPPSQHYLRALFWAIDGRDRPELECNGLLGQAGASRVSLLAQISQSAAARSAITLEAALYRGALPPGDDVAYQLWLDGGFEPPVQHGEVPADETSIVIWTPVTRPDLLGETLASLAGQTSPSWQALLAGPGALEQPDPRVVVAGPAGLPWAAAMSQAALAATGSQIAFIRAGDRLAPAAVAATSAMMAVRPELRLLYTDEDSIAGDGIRSAVVLKSGWSPDLALAGDVVGQLAVFRRDAVNAAGGLRPQAGPHALWDLALRLTLEVPAAHLPAILFHRGRARPAHPQFPRSRVGNGDPALDAIADRHLAHGALRRSARRAGSRIWPVFAAPLPDPAPRVSVIMPSRDRADLLRESVSGLLEATDYPDLELLIVDNGSTEPAARALLERLAGDRRVRVLEAPGPFNWSALNNQAAARATGDVLLLLNNDVSVERPDWLRSMAGHAMRPDVGAVGARLLFPDGRLQHGGVLLGPRGAAVHAYTGSDGNDPGYLAQVALLRDVSAVTGACLAIRREVFQQVGGLEQEHLRVAWSDIDLCLRVREAGYRVLWDPEATLIHHEMATRGGDVSVEQQARHETERAYMRRRWPEATDRDPFLNPALRADPDALVLRTATP